MSQKFEFLVFAKVDITTSGQCSTLITISVLTDNPQLLLPLLNPAQSLSSLLNPKHYFQ